MAKTKPQFRFRRNDTIGAAGAEDDADFLKDCFVDRGDLSILRNMEDNRLVILGRTGSGKSALLSILESSSFDEVIRVSPEQLALTYVANSTVLNFFGSLGVNLDPFFKLLWRHVLTVEILVRHFGDNPEPQKRSLTERLRIHFMGQTKRDKEMRQAVEYLEDWGKSFWLDTEFRVKEITNQVETRLNAQIAATLGTKAAAAIGTSAATDERFSGTEKAELISRGQDIISKAQVQDLHKVLGLIDAVLDDKQTRYYLVIDGLDENWVEERLRYKLIMALMQTARDFNEVRHAKVIVALRRDLVDRVFRLTRDTGLQEEKYQSLYLPLVWTRDEILEVLDKRINRLVSKHYTSAKVGHADLLPKKFRELSIADYIFSVARRPRDVIAFFNTCIAGATNQSKIGAAPLRLAEGEYSRGRLRALAAEWSADYPTLVDFARLLERRSPSFKVGTITDADVANICLEVAAANPSQLGQLNAAMQVVEDILPPSVFKLMLIKNFYHVGLVGLKLAAHEPASWSDEHGKSVSYPEITDQTSVVVHPAYRRALGVRDS